MEFVLGMFSMLLVIVVVGGVILISDVETRMLNLVKNQVKKMQAAINSVKTDLNEVKVQEKKDVLNEILQTIHDYEAIKNLEKNKEVAIKAKEEADMRKMVSVLGDADDEAQQRVELRKLGKEIVERNPILSIDVQKENQKTKEQVLKNLGKSYNNAFRMK